MLDQLPRDHFAFAVGISGNDQLARFAQQPLDRLVLARGLGLDLHLPALGHDGQIRQHPAFVPSVVAVWRRGFQQVADAPCDGNARTHPAAISTPGGTKHLGNVLGLRRFFAEKQPHRVVTRSIVDSAQHAQR